MKSRALKIDGWAFGGETIIIDGCSAV